MNKSLDDEIIFDLYKRNKRIYDDCNLAKRKCPSIHEECYCRFNVPVLPIPIGDQFYCCHFRRKRFISPYEECSICLETIMKESDAYLTNCGHAFHKSCLFKSYEIGYYEHRPYNLNGIWNFFQFNCPLCRKQIINPEFYCRYPQWAVIYNKKNFLDVLEEFWLSKDYSMIQICNVNHSNHGLGMNKNCIKCLKYRNYGTH